MIHSSAHSFIQFGGSAIYIFIISIFCGLSGSIKDVFGCDRAGRAMEPFPTQKNGKPRRPLAELLHEQQEPFMLEEFLTERQYLCNRFECSSRMAAAANSEPLGSANGRALSSLGLPGGRSHGRRSQCKASSPLRSPLAKASCVKSPSRLLEAAVRILEPGLQTCSGPRSSFSFPPAAAHMTTTVRCLLEMDRRAANLGCRSRKRLRKKNPMKPQLCLPPLRSYESSLDADSRNGRNPWRKSLRKSHLDGDCAEGSYGVSDSHGDFIIRRRCTPQEAALSALQRASEALISAFRSSSSSSSSSSSAVKEKEGGVIRYSRIFSFGNKVKKAEKAEENAQACLFQRRARYGLLKSILRRLSPSKEQPANEASGKMRCHSERIESGVQGPNVAGSISKRFSNVMRSFSRGACRQELQGCDEVTLRVRDIVRWVSFDDSEGRDDCVGQSVKGLPVERCVSLECPAENFAGVMSEACLSAEAETGHAETKVASKTNEENWQALLKRRKYAGSDFSTTSSSSAWFESCVDSDCGSTSLDMLSSNGSSEGNGSSDSRELKGIDLCPLEVLSPCGYLSLEVNENRGVKKFHHSPRCDVSRPLMRTRLCDIGCDQVEGIAASDATFEPGYLHCYPSPPCGLCTLQMSDVKGSPGNLVVQASTDISPRCREIEEETVEHIPCLGDNISDTSRHGCNQSDGCEELSDAGCCEEVEQLSPVSVLDSPFEEESSGFEETLANIQRAKQQLLQKICEYERLAHMDPTLLENRMASWKEDPFEDEAYSSCTDNDETRRMGTVLEPAKMDWEEDETEEYVREVLNCFQTVSEDPTSLTVPWGCCLDRRSYVPEDLNDIQMQICAGSCYLTSHSPSQGLKAKQLSEQARRLLFDRVNEELQSPAGKCYGNGFMAELWVREQLSTEQLAKEICRQILAWKEVGTNHTDKLIELDLNRKGGEWRSFRKEAEEIGDKIELAIFGVLVEEVLVDLAHFHISTCVERSIG